MLYVVKYPIFVFLFFILPLLGWAINEYVSKRIVLRILYASLILLAPVLTGYSYIINNMYGYLIYALLTCVYALLVSQITKQRLKLSTSLILSGILFFICGFVAFVGAMAGTITVEKEWRVKGFKIEYVHDQGFSGGPLMTYQLSKYGFIPIFIKHIDTKMDDDTTQSCWVKFKDEGFNFNKCDADSSYIAKNNN